MTNSTRVNELQDKILQAIDIVSGQALNSISYDKTITCTIEDDKDKKEGKYIVSDGSSSFVAYGSDTNLRVGTPVYVTVPEGKFENQKFIVGKKTSEIEEPFLFTRPLDTMFAMEEIKILDSDNNNITSLLANGTEDEKEIYKQQVSYTNYTRLGIKADFSSWIPNAVEGNYGIAIVLNITNKDSIRAQEEAENEAKKDETELTEQKILYLDSSDMFGDPYNFVGDYEQQAVFALDDVTGTITHIKVCGYQLRNFKDIDSELIPYSEPQEDGLEISYLEPNIFIKNVELQLGYDISTFTKDYVEVYTPSGKSYKRSTNASDKDYITRNQKELNVRWVHVDKKNGPINMVTRFEEGLMKVNASLMSLDTAEMLSTEPAYTKVGLTQSTYNVTSYDWIPLSKGIVLHLSDSSNLINLNRFIIKSITYDDGQLLKFNNLIIKKEHLKTISIKGKSDCYVCAVENIIGEENFENYVASLGINGLSGTYSYTPAEVYGYYEAEIVPEGMKAVVIGHTSETNQYTFSEGIQVEIQNAYIENWDSLERVPIPVSCWGITDLFYPTDNILLTRAYFDLVDTTSEYHIYRYNAEKGREELENIKNVISTSFYIENYSVTKVDIITYMASTPTNPDDEENEGAGDNNQGGSGNEGGGGDSGETPPEGGGGDSGTNPPEGGDGNEGGDDEGTEAPRAQYEIRWYRYRVGAAAADQYSNIYWERMYVDENKILQPWTDDREESGCDTTTFTGLIFNPDVNRQQEKIKVIILYRESENNNPIPYYSKELILDNEEDLPPSQEAQHIANALVIKCDDGSNGNYFVYNQGGHITDKSLSDQTRTLSCLFDTDNDGEAESEINDDSRLIWTFPNEENGGSMITGIKEAQSKVEYKIAQRYNSSYKNNVIRCSYNLNGVTYTAEKILSFGTAGTMGTDYTLKIGFSDANRIAYIVGETDLSFTLKMYDNVGKELTIDENIVEWSWHYSANWGSEGELNLGEYKNKLLELKADKVSIPSHININTVLILQAKVGMLETYFPIPITATGDYKYIQGATEVLYQSDGKVNYSKNDYKLFGLTKSEETDSFGPIEGVTWQIYCAENVDTYTKYGKISQIQYNDNKDVWYTKGKNNSTNEDEYSKSTSYIENATYYKKENNYLPTVKTDGTDFSPLAFYIEDIPTYCIRASKNKQIIWSQPILVCQNKYPSDAVNKWDGNSLVLNEADSIIHSAAISAGKKNSDNTFSGVMMGSWEGKIGNEHSISKHTGIYGFDSGDMAYALTDDGKAFFGKSGNGRIYIDGKESTLYSNGWENDKRVRGMKIDLNEPSIVMSSGGVSPNTIELNGSATGGSVSENNSSNAPFKIGTKFYANWDGTIYAEGGVFSGKITSSEGTIAGWELDQNGLIGYTNSAVDPKPSIVLLPSGSRTVQINSSNIQFQHLINLFNNDSLIGIYGRTKTSGGTTYDQKAEINYKGYWIPDIGTRSSLVITSTQTGTYADQHQAIVLDTDVLYCSAASYNQFGIYARFA